MIKDDLLLTVDFIEILLLLAERGIEEKKEVKKEIKKEVIKEVIKEPIPKLPVI